MEHVLGPDYGHGNRAFLQALMAHGAMAFSESQPIIAAILTAENGGEPQVRPDQVTEEYFQDYIDKASRAVSLFDYEIRTAEHQITKKRVHVLVNTASDPQTQLATTYNAEELAFINRLLHAMFDTYNKPRMEVVATTQMQAIKLARPNRRISQPAGDESTQTAIDRGLKHSEVEDTLSSLVGGGWLEKSRAGFYSLTPKGLLELRPWLVETFNEVAEASEWQPIKFCAACKDIVTHGLRCSEPDCLFRIHDICEEAFWRSLREKKCPNCSRDWLGQSYVGERALTMTEAYRKGKNKSSGRRSTLADEVMRQHVGDEEDEGDEAEEEVTEA